MFRIFTYDNLSDGSILFFDIYKIKILFYGNISSYKCIFASELNIEYRDFSITRYICFDIFDYLSEFFFFLYKVRVFLDKFYIETSKDMYSNILESNKYVKVIYIGLLVF